MHKFSLLVKTSLILTAPIIWFGITSSYGYFQNSNIAYLVTPTITTSSSSSNQAGAGSGTISAPATALPNDTPALPLDSTARIQTQEAAMDRTHLSGPDLAPGQGTVTPTLEPPTEPGLPATDAQPDQPTGGSAETSSGTAVVPATELPHNDTPLPTDPTAWMQTQEAALDQSHGSGPTLAPGDSPVTPGPEISSETDSTGASSGSSIPCMTGLLLGVVFVIKRKNL
ncbi:MAG: hypothetical protein KDI79_05825 [Anaerolineae bacterium]|nr:hypothetical protein [Anaerolineae bacterium]